MTDTVFVFKVTDRASKVSLKIEISEEKSFKSLLSLINKKFDILPDGLGDEDEIFWNITVGSTQFDISSPEIRSPLGGTEMELEEGEAYEIDYDLERKFSDEPIVDITLVQTKAADPEKKYPRVINLKKK